MALAEVLRRNTQLFLNCVSDLPADRGATRADEHTNSIEFIVLHLVDARFFLAEYVGIDLDHPYAARFGEAQGIQDIDECPPVSEMVLHWKDLGDRIGDRLERMTRADLD